MWSNSRIGVMNLKVIVGPEKGQGQRKAKLSIEEWHLLGCGAVWLL
jgi:hypothetical protein